jgi:hypothetical protein
MPGDSTHREVELLCRPNEMMPMQTERMMPAQTVHGGMGTGGDDQGRDPVQQLAGVGGLLIPFNGERQY